MPLEALIPREAGWSRFKLALRFTDSKEPDLVRDRSGSCNNADFQSGGPSGSAICNAASSERFLSPIRHYFAACNPGDRSHSLM